MLPWMLGLAQHCVVECHLVHGPVSRAYAANQVSASEGGSRGKRMTGQDNSQARAKDEHSECVWEETIRAAKSSGRARPEVSRGGAPVAWFAVESTLRFRRGPLPPLCIVTWFRAVTSYCRPNFSTAPYTWAGGGGYTRYASAYRRMVLQGGSYTHY